MDRPSIRQLESLVAVADAGSFRRAAAALGISQPALSAQVQAAEALLGVQVFERDRRSVLITAAGEDVVGRAREALAAIDLVGDAARRRGEPVPMTLPSSNSRIGVTLSEVRPDGKETFIQAGVLRAANRKVAKGSTALLPLHTGYESDAEPLTRNEWTEARVEVFPFAQIVRAGSRIRLSVHTPGGDRPRWSYIIDQQPNGTTIDVGHSAAHPSRLVMPLSPDLLASGSYPATLPACPSLRGQPCRAFVPYANESVDDR